MNLEWVLVGEIVSSQGNRGEVRVLPQTDFPERFLDMTEVTLFRQGASTPSRVLQVTNARRHKRFVVLKLEGIDSIDDALSLKDSEIKVPKEDVVPLPAGHHYVFELIGMHVVTTEGLLLGTLSDVLTTAANDVYVVKPVPNLTKNREILLPAIGDVVVDVDLDNKEILVNLLDGLLD